MNVNKINSGSLSDESEFGSADLRSESSSSEDENARIGYMGPPNPRIKKRGKKKGGADGSIKWEVGDQFENMEEFRNRVRKYGIDERRPVQFVTNDRNRCQVVCDADCSFYIWCSKDKNSDNCTIKTLIDEHLCSKPYNNNLATVKYLAEIYGDRLRKNPQWKIKEMAETIKQELEIEVPRIKILRVRKLALEGVYESLKEQYSRLRDFAQEILRSNPQNTVKISTTRLNKTDENKFKRVYVCYFALKAGCRPLIGLDGCFLKTVCGGQLLSAVGRDGNNQMFPIAYALVESENTDSWRWFLDLLKDDLDIGAGIGLTLISDQQKGLENAVKELLPQVEHRFCTRYLYSNFRKRFSSLLMRRAFWNATCATHPAAHTKAMARLERLSKPAAEQLRQLDAKMWSKAYFATHSKADNVENNMSESFNAWIIHERYMPILTMMQELHFKLMTRMRVRRDEMRNSEHTVCPRIKKRLDVLVTQSRNWTASWDGMKLFSVKNGARVVRVDLDGRSCDCRVFDLTGIPCEHAIAAIRDRRHKPVDYLSEYYKRPLYLAAYNHSLEAIKGEEFWDVFSTDELLPPDIPRKLRGRPKKLRRREHWEGGSRSQSLVAKYSPLLQRFTGRRVMHCILCKQSGHNKKTCPGKPNDGDAPTKGKSVESSSHKATPAKRKSAEGSSHKATPKQKSAKELRRQKLQVRRKGMATGQDGNEKGKEIAKSPDKSDVGGSRKGKEIAKSPEIHVEDEYDGEDENYGEGDQFGAYDLFADNDLFEDSEVPHEKIVEVTENDKVAEVSEKDKITEVPEIKKKAEVPQTEKIAEVDHMGFLGKIPKKKMLFVPGQTEDWGETGRNYVKFQEKLRGTLGHHAVFMPTPRVPPYMGTRSTPPASTPPFPLTQQSSSSLPVPTTQQSSSTKIAQKRGSQQSTSSAPKRRSSRLSKAFKFRNTEDAPLELED